MHRHFAGHYRESSIALAETLAETMAASVEELLPQRREVGSVRRRIMVAVA
jgi:hypothetical protein